MVVDAFRASTTIAVLVSKGVRVVPVASIEEAASYPGAAYRLGSVAAPKPRVSTLATRRRSNPPSPAGEGCGARRAERVVELYLTRPEETLRRNSAARRLKRLGYEEDLDFCLAEDTVPVVPRLRGGAFVGQG